MCGKADLLGQTERLETRTIQNHIALRPRRPVPVAMTAPERQNRKRRVHLA
jgi:hypothetical protein